MNYATASFFLNLRDTTSQTYLRIKNGDTARTYRATLIDGDLVYRLSPDCYAKLIAKLPDGNTVLTNCRIIDNKVTFNLTPSLTTAEGYVEAEIRIYSNESELVITTPRFYMMAEASLYNEVAPVEPVYAGTIVTLAIPSYAWIGEGSPWSQTVLVDKAITAHSKVDLQPTPEQLESFRSQELALTTRNDNGTLTVLAIGDKPKEDLTMQAIITEVQ